MKNLLFLFVLFAIFAVKSFATLEIANGPVTNLTATNVWLVGNLVSTNATNATLTCYYGTGNGSTNPALWQYSNAYGVAANTGLVSIATTNSTGDCRLTPATWYYFRWQAADLTSSAWAATSSNFTTLATVPTSYPAAGAGRGMVADTNGNVLFPTNPIFPAITLGGVKHTTWPEHGTNDLTFWSLYPALYDLDLGTQSVTIGGVTRTTWPVDATDVAASNAALGIRVGSLEVGASNISLVVTGLVNYSTNYATHAWLIAQGYFSSTGYPSLFPYFDARYSALGHLHSGVYSPTGHLHTGVYSPFGAATSNHLHEGTYLRNPTNITTNTPTNYIAFFDGTNAAGGVKTRFGPAWSGHVTNWTSVGISTSEVIFPKLSLGPIDMLRPQLLNLFATNEVWADMGIYGAVQMFSVTNYPTVANDLGNAHWEPYPEDLNALLNGGTGSMAIGNHISGHGFYGPARVSSFGFSVPDNAVIRGVVVGVLQGHANVGDKLFFRIWNNGYTSQTNTLTCTLHESQGMRYLGTNNSIWGLSSLLPTEVNSADFSIDFSSELFDGAEYTPQISRIEVIVYYSTESFNWQYGVDTDGKFVFRHDAIPYLTIFTNIITLGVPLSVPQITLGTNPPISDWSQGPAGSNGAPGSAATIAVAWVSNGPPGSAVVVTNVGDSTNASFGFTIPVGYNGTNGVDGTNGAPGETGPAGTNGLAATITVAWVSNGPPGSAVVVTNVGDSTNASFGFTIPVGYNGTNGVDGTNGAPGETGQAGSAGPVTNQIMDVNGVLYTITNAPPASGKYVWGLNPANSTAWFAAESPGGGTTGLWTGAASTGLLSSTTADTNKILRGDGTWIPHNISSVDSVSTSSASSVWSSGPELPYATAKSFAGVLGNKLYVGAGMSENTGVTNFYSFDGTNWVSAPACFAQRDGVGCVFQNKLYEIGGYNGDTPTNVFAFDGTNWTEIAGLPGPGAQYTGAAAYQDKLYVVGGASSTNCYIYDGTNWTWGPATPFNGCFSATVFRDKIYCVSGGETAKTNFYSFDGTNWVSEPELPAAVTLPGVATNNLNQLLVMGGADPWTTESTNVFIFDGTNWSSGAALPGAGYNAGAAPAVNLNGSIYLLGNINGYSLSTNVFVQTLVPESVSTNFYTQFESMTILSPQSTAPVAVFGGFYTDNAGVWYRCTNGTTWSSF